MFDLPAAIVSLKPGAQWSLNGDNYEGLNWLDESQTKPTKEECMAEMVRLKGVYDNKEYQINGYVEDITSTQSLIYLELRYFFFF